MPALNPIEREREYARRALKRYLKACGFKPFVAGSSDELQRYRKKQVLVELNLQKSEYAITPCLLQSRFVTRAPGVFLAQMERVMEESKPQAQPQKVAVLT